MMVQSDLFTIGHSNHSIDRFIDLLRSAGVTAIADVRSTPFSRWVPHFSRPALERHLKLASISYVFLGEQLGGRPRDKACWRAGRVDYDLVAATDGFRQGLDRVEIDASRHRIALICAERDPLDCHRFLLVSRRLAERGVKIGHLLANGSLEGQVATEQRMLESIALNGAELFDSIAPMNPRIAHAYQARIDRIVRRVANSSKQ